MRKPTSLRRLVLVLMVSLFTLGVSSDAVACLFCKDSPNGWGFCRAGSQSGYVGCREIVEDSFSGRTDCETWGVCYNGGTVDRWVDSSGGTSSGGNCWWTALDGSCLI